MNHSDERDYEEERYNSESLRREYAEESFAELLANTNNQRMAAEAEFWIHDYDKRASKGK